MVSEIVTRWSVCTWLLGVCWKGEGGGGGGGGEEEEGLFKADAVDGDTPRDRDTLEEEEESLFRVDAVD